MIYKLFFASIFLISSNIVIAEGNEQKGDSLSTLEFSFVGDIMCHSTQFKFAQVDDDSFDFKPVYREIKPYFDNSDVVVANLETVIEVEEVKFSGYPVFNTPKHFLGGLKFAGFNFLSTANNHSFDIRERGVYSTLKHIENYGMHSVGSYKSQSSRDSVKIHEQNGIKFAILSYTFGVNLYKIPDEKSYLVNRINEDLIENDIQNHRKDGADLIILFFHFGTEYATEPSNYQNNIVQKSIEFGADLIIGAHPHSLQPIKYFKSVNGNIDSGFVAYSLGNFVSNQRWRYSDGGAVLNFTVTKNNLNGNISLAEVRYLPIWVYKGYTENGLEYVVLPSATEFDETTPSFLASEDLDLMEECYYDTKAILTSSTKNIKIDSIEKSNLRRKNRNYLANRLFIDRIP
ncbi:MAG: CapA family protein, partial [Melioribacteraceae bacterium]|nr:CapA family protein [Melioribacteraceae bacterium]